MLSIFKITPKAFCFWGLIFVYISGSSQSSKKVSFEEAVVVDCSMYKGGSSVFFSLDNEEYLAARNNDLNELTVYSLNNLETPIHFYSLDVFSKRFTVNYSRYYFKFKSLDSLYILADDLDVRDAYNRYIEGSRSIVLLTNEGRNITSWNIDSIFPNDDRIHFDAVDGRNPILFSGSKMYLTKGIGKYNVFNTEQRALKYAVPQELEINFSNSPPTVSNAMGKVPQTYTDNFYYQVHTSRCIDDRNRLVYSYGADHALHVYENGTFVKSVPAKSKYIKNKKPFDVQNKFDHFEVHRYFMEEPYYYKIHYDKYRKLYYREVLHRMQYENEDGSFNEDLSRKRRSIMIFDEELQLIDEVLIDKNYSHLAAVTPKGLVFFRYNKGISDICFFHVKK